MLVNFSYVDIDIKYIIKNSLEGSCQKYMFNVLMISYALFTTLGNIDCMIKARCSILVN